jgi:hypothetical protein
MTRSIRNAVGNALRDALHRHTPRSERRDGVSNAPYPSKYISGYVYVLLTKPTRATRRATPTWPIALVAHTQVGSRWR